MIKLIEKLHRIFYWKDIYWDIVRKIPLLPKSNSFDKRLKSNYNFTTVEQTILPLNKISSQFNPERFEQYKSVHEGVYDGVLDISRSSHCKLLRDYIDKGENVWHNFHNHPYYRMQRRFGKSRKATLAKAKRLIDLFEAIKTNGFKGQIKVIETPVVPNPYNTGYEIYDGHHRAACCCVLGIKKIDAIVLRVSPK